MNSYEGSRMVILMVERKALDQCGFLPPRDGTRQDVLALAMMME